MILAKVAASEGLPRVNREGVPTFTDCPRQSVIDLMFFGEKQADWRVLEEEMPRDHSSITFAVTTANNNSNPIARIQLTRP